MLNSTLSKSVQMALSCSCLRKIRNKISGPAPHPNATAEALKHPLRIFLFSAFNTVDWSFTAALSSAGSCWGPGLLCQRKTKFTVCLRLMEQAGRKTLEGWECFPSPAPRPQNTFCHKIIHNVNIQQSF